MFTECLEKVVQKTHCDKCDFICSTTRDWNRHISTDKHKRTEKVVKKYHCELCDYISVRRCDYDKHLVTSKHKKMTILVGKVAQFYQCEICDYKSNRLCDYDNHLLTSKHKQTTNVVEKAILDPKDLKKYECVCGKDYKCKQTLYVHKKNCPHLVSKEDSGITTQMFMEVLKQNQEFQKMLFEQNTKMMELAMNNPQTINSNSNNNTTTNNKFNLTFFLDNQCNDAMNLSDFLDTLHITVADTERVGAEGFIEGITKIFLNGLNQLDIYKRPIHCTDLKRETMF
jgi:hypothetical protein